MTDPLEQRLRDALEAYAQTVKPEDLDRSRERHLADIVDAHTESRRSRWGWRLGAVGLAAATLVVGSLTIGHLTDSSSSPPQADLLPGASSQHDDAGGEAESRAEAPVSSSTHPAPSEHATRHTSPTPTTEPSQRSEPQPTPSHDRREPTQTTAPSHEPEPTSAAPTSETAAPRTFAMTSPRTGSGRLQVRVDSSPTAWSATASGTASSTTPTGGVLRYTVDHGDGTVENRTVRDGCESAAPVRPVTFSTGEQPHQYDQSGTFRIKVEVEYCAQGDRVEVETGTSTVAIP